MIRVGDLTLFQELHAGQVLPFTADRARTVRLTFNAPHRTVINVVPMHPDGSFPEDEPPYFLAAVEGLETVEFYALGAFAIEADAAIVWVQTADGKPIHAVVPDAATFTRIVERRVRNPEVEAMQAMLLANQERRMGLAMAEMRAEFERRESEREAEHSAESAARSDPPAPQPASGPGEPAGSATPNGGGNTGGEGDAERP